MMLNESKRKEFENVTRPAIKWLNDNCHPHVSITITPSSACLHEHGYYFPTDDYILD